MPPASPRLELDRVSVAWEAETIVHDVSLAVAPGELVSLLGPNGSGKSTLLRAVAGFLPLRAGAVRLDGVALDRVPPHRRSIGLLFQEPTLFPRRSVWENIAYAPLLGRRPDAEIRNEVAELSELLELDPLLDRRPQELSGGERQRVALARSLAARPKVVLLDEPFASVDPEIRGALLGQFRRALVSRQTSAIHVTHDREEGLFLGDRVALLLDGRLAALGPPAEVFAHPPDARTARFLGYNVLHGPASWEAVLPEDLMLRPGAEGAGGYTVLASGASGRGFRAVLAGPDGGQVEVRSSEPLPRAGRFDLRWERGAPVAAPVGPDGRPQNPRRAAR